MIGVLNGGHRGIDLSKKKRGNDTNKKWAGYRERIEVEVHGHFKFP